MTQDETLHGAPTIGEQETLHGAPPDDQSPPTSVHVDAFDAHVPPATDQQVPVLVPILCPLTLCAFYDAG